MNTMNIGCIDKEAYEVIGGMVINILNTRTYWWVKLKAVKMYLDYTGHLTLTLNAPINFASEGKKK
jgi:hypothetical protein